MSFVGRPIKYGSRCVQKVIMLPNSLVDSINKRLPDLKLNFSQYIQHACFYFNNLGPEFERAVSQRFSWIIENQTSEVTGFQSILFKKETVYIHLMLVMIGGIFL